MVFDFPLDPMHLIYHGVVKRFLTILFKGDRRNKSRHRLSKQTRIKINSLLKKKNRFYPREFHRKRKAFDDLSFLKAVELRSFLLYMGPVVLKKIGKRKYEHFLFLHATIRILTFGPLTPEVLQTADQYLKYYVEQFGIIYGDHHLVYNLHSLTHLVNECATHGLLDSFSAFPFENFLGLIKRLIRSGHNPLAQLVRRLSEYDSLGLNSFIHKTKESFTWACIRQGLADSVVLLREGLFVKIISQTEDDIYYQQFTGVGDFYKEPLPSSAVGVFEVQHLNDQVMQQPKNLFPSPKKCFIVPYCSKFIIMPLIHQLY